MDSATAAWLFATLLASNPPPSDPTLAEVMTKCSLSLEPSSILAPIEIGRSQRLRFTIESSGQGRDATYESTFHLLEPSKCRLVVLLQTGGGGSPREHARLLATKGKVTEKERGALLDWAGVVLSKDKGFIPELAPLGDAPSTGAELWASKPTKFEWTKKPTPPANLAKKLGAKECKQRILDEEGTTAPTNGPAEGPECYEFFFGSRFEPAGRTELEGSTIVLYATKARNSSLLIALEAQERFAWVGWVFGVSQPKILGVHEERIWIKVRNLEVGDQLIAIDSKKLTAQRVGLIADGTIDADANGLTLDEMPLVEWKRVVKSLGSTR